MKVILEHYSVVGRIPVDPPDIEAAIKAACRRLGHFKDDVEYVIPGPLPHLVVEVRKAEQPKQQPRKKP